MRKISIGFVIYNTTPSLISRLKLALESGFTVYVFDNSPENGIARDFCKSETKCIYTTCGKNVGLGFGISSVCAQAYYDSFLASIFFDQDTMFDKSTLDFIEEFYTRNRSLESNYSAVTFNARNFSVSNVGDKFKFNDVLMTINSGSLFFLENLKKLNWLNETYFVDCVDYEFCLNSSNNNMKIGECSITPGYDHDTEQGDTKYFIFGKQRKLRKYSATRVLDTALASSRLLFASIVTGNIKFSMAILRSLTGYLFWQLFVRLIKVIKP